MSSRDWTIPGVLLRPLELERSGASLLITSGNKPRTLRFRSTGLVVSYNGGGDGANGDQVLVMARELATAVADRGGINMSGGRRAGIMGAVMNARPESAFGVLAKNQLDKKSEAGGYAIVDSKHTRLEILSILAPIVVAFPGGIGTVQEWVTSLVAWKDHLGGYADVPAPQLFLYASWKPVIDALLHHSALSPRFAEKIIYFTESTEVLDSIE